jgi:hypothetical protein
MGGVGKTMLTSCVIREEKVRKAFSIICVRRLLLYANISMTHCFQTVDQSISATTNIASTATVLKTHIYCSLTTLAMRHFCK